MPLSPVGYSTKPPEDTEPFFTSFCFLAKLSVRFVPSLSRPWVWKGPLEPHLCHVLCSLKMYYRDNGTAFQSFGNGREISQQPSNREELPQIPAQREACLWLLCSSWDSWPLKPASGFESWSLPSIIALHFFFLSPIISCSGLILML